MDVAGELAKCKVAAEKSVKRLVGVLAPSLVGSMTEQITTALLAARADALRAFSTPYRGDLGPGPAYELAETMEAEVHNRTVRGL